MWTNCRFKIAYCCELQTWIFDKTPWTDADQSLTIRTLLLTGRHRHGNSTAGHSRSSPTPLWPPSSALTGKMVSGQSTKTNKAASDVTNEARVVMSFACVEWYGFALSPTGCRLAVYTGPFRRHQSNDRLWDNYRHSALFLSACWPIMRDRVNVAVTGLVSGEQCTRDMYTMSYDLRASR